MENKTVRMDEIRHEVGNDKVLGWTADEVVWLSTIAMVSDDLKASGCCKASSMEIQNYFWSHPDLTLLAAQHILNQGGK